MANESPRCLKCGSADLIPDARLGVLGRADLLLKVSVYENPEALLFKGAHDEFVRVTICGQCGFIEHTVTNPQELFKVYQRSKKT